LIIFRFINGKDVFEAFYKKDLAKRLLLGKRYVFEKKEKEKRKERRTKYDLNFKTNCVRKKRKRTERNEKKTNTHLIFLL